MTPSFYKCALFSINVEDLSDFQFDQEEVIFDKSLEGGKASFNKIKVQYKKAYLDSQKSKASLEEFING